MDRRQYVWSLDVLACCRVDEPSAFPSGPLRLLLRSGRTWYEVFCSFCVLFAAYLAWHLGTLARTMPKAIGGVGWILFAYSLVGVYISWIDFSGFVLLLTAAIAICIGWATWLTRSASPGLA